MGREYALMRSAYHSYFFLRRFLRTFHTEQFILSISRCSLRISRTPNAYDTVVGFSNEKKINETMIEECINARVLL